jgi:hypothetical protein
MIEVLRKKKSPGKWVEWMKQIIEGGEVGININKGASSFLTHIKG